MPIESQLIGLMIISVFVAATAKRFRMPYTIAMVLTGLVMGLFSHELGVTQLGLEPHLILVTFLPGLVFEAAYHLDLQELRENLRTILTLAIPGVLLTTFIIGFLLHQFIGLKLTEALLFGSLIAATDPVSVVAIFKELGVNKRLSIMVEGESLFNDGVAIVLYSILLGLASGDQTFSFSQSVIDFFVTVAGGAALGLIMGLIFNELMRRTEDHLLDIALTTILAYGTYLLAEEVLHGAVSPVIAVVVAAVYVGNYASRGAYSATSQNTIITFWEFLVFLINSAVFLLLGLEVRLEGIIANIVPILITIAVVMLARAIVVYPLHLFVSRFIRKTPKRWSHVLFWGGLRGAVSVALALSIPSSLASRPLLEAMAFGYVLFSLIVQGLTIKPLLSMLGMTKLSERREEYEHHRARIAMGQAALEALDCVREEQTLAGPVCNRLRTMYTNQIRLQWEQLEELIREEPSLTEANVRQVEREIINRQKQSLQRLMRRGIISEHVYSELNAEIDERDTYLSSSDWQEHKQFLQSEMKTLSLPPFEELNPQSEKETTPTEG